MLIKLACSAARFLIVVLFTSIFSYAQDGATLEEEKNAIIAEGLKLVYSARYDEAIDHFRELDEIDPGSAEAIFFEAFVLELIMDVYRSQVFDDSLNSVVEKAITKAEKAVKLNPTARNYMFLGGLFGVKGVRKGILGSWFGAAMDGRKANKNFETAVKMDTSFYDSYYGIGSYHYWKTKKLKRFFGFFISDQREKGISEIIIAIDNGIFTETPGRMALFRIYIEEKRYDDVIELADLVLRETPDHLFPRWYLGIALIRTEQWKKAKDNYEHILTILPNFDFHGIEAEIEAKYYAGLAYYNLGNTENAQQMLEEIPSYKDKVNQHLFYYGNYIKDSRKILDKLKKK
ncbi:tetratricopeptide repeat protein [candidate division KSB1 bacterium]|nr:tetratricopeptide repeat protein [candidate division KSB1 bacterium]